MPSIEITQEQADALARGEEVTLEAKALRRTLAVNRAHGAYVVEGDLRNPTRWRRVLDREGNLDVIDWDSYGFDFTAAESFTLIPLYA